MHKKILHWILPLFVCSGCTTTEPSNFVNPMVGTGFHGHTYPGATTPFGAVQLSPDTRRGNWDACSGYHYSDTTLLGFSHTHLSGTGCIDLGDLLFHPTTGEIIKNREGDLFDAIPFSHKNESAQPGYYRVKLDNGILAELTATAHTGIHKYTFPPEGEPKIILDLAHLLDNETILEAELNYQNGEITGMRSTRGWVDKQYVFFAARFSKSFEVELISDGVTTPSNEKIRGKKLQAVLRFAGSQGESIIAKVGVSSVSIENARINLDQEAKTFDFESIAKEAQDNWNRALSIAKVSGGQPDDKVNFYTALYHTMVTPNVISDTNGQYRGADQQIHTAGPGKVYSTFSLWDTFRAWNPLITLTDTTLVNNMINSFLNFYDQTGELPLWPLSSGETGTMIGYHSVSVIYDAYSKNIRGFDVEKAFQAMKISAEKNKKGITPYLDLGFIPSDSKRESVSCLLEGAYDDWCIAQMAKSLGHNDDYQYFIERAGLYKNVFDGQTGFFRGRLRDGSWESPFNAYEPGRAYTEATAWQYRFFVPQDVNGMINLMGGIDSFRAALDSLFNTKETTKGHLSDITGLVGQYAHGNEPSHHIAYLYSFAGQPWKTQYRVRHLLKEMYQPAPEGISGNEDCGQMSAWYVLSSLGLYQVCPGSQQYILSSPLFKETELHLANGKTLIIKANNPETNPYIHEVYFNGACLKDNFITYSQLMEGGELKFVLDKEPNRERGTTSDTYPYSVGGTNEVSVPYISNNLTFFEKEVLVNCGCATVGAEIRYTLDGSEPSDKSAIYKTPFLLDHSATVKLKGFKTGLAPSITTSYCATKADPLPAAKVNPAKNGVVYRYFEGNFQRTSDITNFGTEIKRGTCAEPTLSLARIPDHFGFIFNGYILTPKDGVYSFSTRSDDGSLLKIDDQIVVDNDGSHADIRAVGRIALKKGFHPFELIYFEDYEGENLQWRWTIPGKNQEEPISTENLFCK